MAVHLRGVYAPVVTPFRGDDVDLPAFASNLARYGRTRLAGIVVLGSNSEAPLLDDAECDRVLEAARPAVPRTQLLVAGTGRESTRGTIAATQRAAAAGADAVIVRTPSFFRAQMSSDHFVRHYESVADASPVPVLLYNVTVFTGVTLPVDAFARLAAHPNIIGIKESGPDLELLGQYIAQAPAGFAVLGGAHATLLRGRLHRCARGRARGGGRHSGSLCRSLRAAPPRAATGRRSRCSGGSIRSATSSAPASGWRG